MVHLKIDNVSDALKYRGYLFIQLTHWILAVIKFSLYVSLRLSWKLLQSISYPPELWKNMSVFFVFSGREQQNVKNFNI